MDCSTYLVVLRLTHSCCAISQPEVVSSLERLYADGVVLPGGQVKRFALLEIRGDWKWQADTSTTFKLLTINKSNIGVWLTSNK